MTADEYRARAKQAMADWGARMLRSPREHIEALEKADYETRRSQKKPRKSKYPSEADESKKLRRWLLDVAKLTHKQFTINKDGVYYSSRFAARRSGKKKGRADYEITARCPAAPDVRGIAIELKSLDPKARASDEQQEYLDEKRADGWATCVARGSDQAIEFLKGLGFGR